MELILILYLTDKIFFNKNLVITEERDVDFISDSEYKYFYISREGVTNSIFNGEIITFTTNSDGLRDRFNYTREKPENTFRIGVFGDSFVEGLLVNIENVFTEVLEDRLNSLGCSNNIEVINFGVGGYDVPYTIELYERKGKKYNSDINIFVIKNDDIIVINELYIPIQRKYTPQLDDTDKNTLYIRSKAAKEGLKEYDNKYKNINWFEKITPSLSKISNVSNSKTLIFDFMNTKEYTEKIRNYSKENNILFTSLFNLKEKSFTILINSFTLIPGIDSHLNKKGHILLSDIMFLYLTTNNLIECN